MTCKNEGFYFVPRGYSYRKIKARCGSTAYNNGVFTVFCKDCQNDKKKQAEHKRQLELSKEDNAWLASAGYGEI